MSKPSAISGENSAVGDTVKVRMRRRYTSEATKNLLRELQDCVVVLVSPGLSWSPDFCIQDMQRCRKSRWVVPAEDGGPVVICCWDASRGLISPDWVAWVRMYDV